MGAESFIWFSGIKSDGWECRINFRDLSPNVKLFQPRSGRDFSCLLRKRYVIKKGVFYIREQRFWQR